MSPLRSPSVLAPLVLAAAVPAQAQYAIPWYTVDGGERHVQHGWDVTASGPRSASPKPPFPSRARP
jgi:hypothetical protein